jgi:hypothetical protein
MNFPQGNHKLRLKNVHERENTILKNRYVYMQVSRQVSCKKQEMITLS